MEVGPLESIHIRQLEVNWNFLWDLSFWILARLRFKIRGLPRFRMMDIQMGIWQESGHNFVVEILVCICINHCNMKTMIITFDVRKPAFPNI
jgi:hypothetical protein